MKRLFLASSIDRTASAIANLLGGAGSKKLVFVDTAAEAKEGDLGWLRDDRQGLVDAGFEVTDYTLTGKTREEIHQDLAAFDIIHVNGGNTFYLLEKIQETNCADVIREFVEAGKIYIGSSAGSIVAGPDIYPSYNLANAQKAPHLNTYEGLGLTDIVILPHWGSAYFRPRYLDQKLAHNYNEEHKLILLNDNQFVAVEDDRYRIVDINDEG